MFRRALSWCLTLTLLVGPAAAVRAQGTVGDAEVAKGIRQIDEGDYDSAIITLDSATRRLAASAPRSADLTQAYLYLGVAYLGKGHESSAKARFRDALGQSRDLSLSPEKFAPRVIEIFEKAKDETRTAAPAPAASTTGARAPEPEKKGGGGKKALLILGLGGAAAGGVAIAAGGGGSDGGGGASPSGFEEIAFENEQVVFGGGRDFVVNVSGSGNLLAKVQWNQPGVVLGLYIVNLANAGTVLADGNQSGSNETQLQTQVGPGSYRISVTNSTGSGPMVTTTFTLRVMKPSR
jgi:hypothetical protein